MLCRPEDTALEKKLFALSSVWQQQFATNGILTTTVDNKGNTVQGYFQQYLPDAEILRFFNCLQVFAVACSCFATLATTSDCVLLQPLYKKAHDTIFRKMHERARKDGPGPSFKDNMSSLVQEPASTWAGREMLVFPHKYHKQFKSMNKELQVVSLVSLRVLCAY